MIDFSLSWGFPQTSEIMVYQTIIEFINFMQISLKIEGELVMTHSKCICRFYGFLTIDFLIQVMHFVINWIKLLNQERQIQERITDLKIYLKTINLVWIIPFQK